MEPESSPEESPVDTPLEPVLSKNQLEKLAQKSWIAQRKIAEEILAATPGADAANYSGPFIGPATSKSLGPCVLFAYFAKGRCIAVCILGADIVQQAFVTPQPAKPKLFVPGQN